MNRKRLLALALCLALFLPSWALGQEETNLVVNGGFEEVDEYGDAANWYQTSYRKEQGYSRLTVTEEKAHSGRKSALIENASLNDARFVYTAKVEPNSLYRLSAYTLVESMGETGNGANLAVEDLYAASVGVFDTANQWQYMEWYGKTGSNQTEVTFGVRLGGYGAESLGKAYFDDVSLVKVDDVPTDAALAVWYTVATPAPASAKDGEPQKSTALFALLAAVFAALFLLGKPLLSKENHKAVTLFFGLALLGAAVLRVLIAINVKGYDVDIGCFTAWSLRMAGGGPVGFYAPDYFCDYPPGYLLLLWPVGLLLNAMGAFAAPVGTWALVAVKALPILCDLLGATLLYAAGKKKIGSIPAAFVASLYAFSPAVLVNGAAWGQADSVLALVLLLCVGAALKRQWNWALPLYTVAVLLKPQALLFAPVAGAWLIGVLVREKRDWKRLFVGLAAAVAAALVIVVPFSIGQEKPVGWLLALYGDTLSSYAYATLNTANLYYLLAANWKALNVSIGWLLPVCTALAALFGAAAFALREKRWRLKRRNPQLSLLLALFAAYQLCLAIFGGSYSLYGYGMMALVYAFVIVCLLHDRDAERLPFYLALCLIGVYLFAVKVHERYLFTALPLLLFSYLRSKDRRELWLFVGFSVTTFLNTAIVLDNSILFGATLGHLNDDTLALNVLLCVCNLLLAAYGALMALVPPKPQKRETAPSFQVPKCYEDMLLAPKDARLRLRTRDYLIMLAVTAAYAVLAFSNLGSTVAPQDGWVSSSPDETVVFELPENEPFYFLYYAGVSYHSFSIAVSDDGERWSADFPCEMREGMCYTWNYALQSNTSAEGSVSYAANSPQGRLMLTGKYLKLNAKSAGLNLFEIALRDPEGSLIPLTVYRHDNANPAMLAENKPPENLLNEQDTCVGEPGWYNGMYFDEIYHARTAYEHLHGQAPYETTHPPLGKLLMAAGIALFGMTPFGWRFAGALIGVLMLPALYLLAKQLLHKRDMATLCMCAFALDLMHYTQTRIATIDSFPVFFIILSYLCMVRYMQTDLLSCDTKPTLFSKAYLKSLIPLGLSGLFMGLSIASKWIGLYSAVGLAVLFFSAVFRQYRAGNFAYSYLAREDAPKEQARQARLLAAQSFTLKRILLTCGFCVAFFIAVPALIYYLCYIPYLAPTGPVTVDRVIKAQIGMLNYHSTPGLGMDHPFQSPWWQWPLILKPIWFCRDVYEPNGMASTIMCMGNPWVFYLGALCMAAVLALWALKYLRVGKNGLSLARGDGDLSLYVLVIGFASQYLPWVLVPRSMYIYHYFASVPFIILATAWMVNRIPESRKKLRRGVIALYLAGAAVFFALFFPYASGWLTDIRWLDAMRWFSKLYY